MNESNPAPESDTSENNNKQGLIRSVQEFMQLESSGGILLVVAVILAMIAENSPLVWLYDSLLDIPLEIHIGDFAIAKPLLLWINDGLMAVFFFHIGLEIKREMKVGELSDPARITLPVIAAIGGMAVPALIYSAINWDNPVAMQGWAIPSATDIAFALGVMSLLGDRVPQSLKLFLMTLAIVDDLGAIIIIALFYTSDLSVLSLMVATVGIATLAFMNRRGVISITPYLLVGLVVWVAVLKSGVHATLAGVIVAMLIPFKARPGERDTQLEKLEHDLQPAVVFIILPLFAFANTGIPLAGLGLESLLHPVPVGIAAGLFLGNPLGVFTLSWLSVRLGIAKLPEDVSWGQLFGASLLCGIGFTMSLFISSLAFEQTGQSIPVDDRLGILLGTMLSGVSGYLVLRLTSRPQK
jgi:Na+:H+ antiporter, NhaA family